jgi:hypothetical protein
MIPKFFSFCRLRCEPPYLFEPQLHLNYSRLASATHNARDSQQPFAPCDTLLQDTGETSDARNNLTYSSHTRVGHIHNAKYCSCHAKFRGLEHRYPVLEVASACRQTSLLFRPPSPHADSIWM